MERGEIIYNAYHQAFKLKGKWDKEESSEKADWQRFALLYEEELAAIDGYDQFVASVAAEGASASIKMAGKVGVK